MEDRRLHETIRARGYRDRENFHLAILFHCGGLDMDPR